MRTVQKLSLLYGFEFNTDDEIAQLWIAAASAAGVDVGGNCSEKEVVNRFVPRVIQRIAAKASAEVVEKWAGRLIPLASSAIERLQITGSCGPGGNVPEGTSGNEHLKIGQERLGAPRPIPLPALPNASD